jgi:tetratricopeptide (TPR) repeat protein
MKSLNIHHIIAPAVLAVAAFVGQASAQSDPPELRYYKQGVTYVQTGNLELATEAFHASVLSNPRFADAWLMLSGTLLDLGYLEEGEKCLRKAIELKPELETNPDVNHLLEIFGIREPRAVAGVGISPEGKMAVGADARRYIYLGMLFAVRGEIEKATRSFLAAVRTDSGNAEAWIWLGFGLFDLGHQQLTYKCLKRGLAIKPELGENELIKSVLAEIGEGYPELPIQ